MREKICFGGTFNPIHHGHLLCARAAAEAVGAKQVILFPTGQPAHRAGQTDLADSAHRIQMCRLAIDGIEGFEIDDRECRRPGPTFTIDTARELKRGGWQNVTWLIGADMLNALPKWRKPEALLKEVDFLVMARPGIDLIWESLPQPFRFLQHNVVPVPQIDISATEIRKRIGLGKPIDFFCPPVVCAFIASIGYTMPNSSMINHYDIAYSLGVGISAPFWLARRSTRTKVLRAFSQRMGHVAMRDTSRPAIMIHAVSLGEINATRSLIERLRATHGDIAFIVSVTTETGYARGLELYGSAADVTLVRYPLDFSVAVDRLLLALRPSVVVLMELEVWPNFIRRCAQRKIPVLLINGRITPGSFRKYRLAQPLVGSMFARLTYAAVQDETYARRFEELGVPKSRISITGTMKFDSATVADSLPGQTELAEAVGLTPGKDRIWVCGSTGPGEEAIILPIYRRLLEKFPDLRLVIVPRKPERFDEAAEIITSAEFPIIRRSRPREMPANSTLPAIVLGDTIGELRKFYALAEVVFVGRTLVDLGHRQHGSDMIEPAALGKPVVVGPFTANFADAMDRFNAADAMMVVQNPQELERTVEKMLANPAEARRVGERARDVVKAGQGATQRNAAIILDTLGAVLTMDPQ